MMMQRLTLLGMIMLLFAWVQSCQGECLCGQSCTMEGGGTGVCFEDGTCAVSVMAVQCPLSVGDVCHSGGVESGPGVDRRNDCPEGSSCRPKSGEMAIGGEVMSTCQLNPLDIGDVCHSGGVETGEGVDRRNDCPPGSMCLPKAGEMAIGGEVTSICQMEVLRLGDVCKSGGVETGPGVDREHDCPIGSICSPKEGEAAIGGEVSSICQAHDNPLPLGGICSISGSEGLDPTTCVGDLACIIIDAGQPEVDDPNRGICLAAGAALPIGATCHKASDSTEAIGAIPCAPTLQCVLSQSSEDPLALTCQRSSRIPIPIVSGHVPSAASTWMRCSWLTVATAWLVLVTA